MKSCGLDISTKTGMVILDHQGVVPCAEELVCPGKLVGLDRASIIAGEMLERLNAHKPDIVMVEGYGFGNTNTLAILVEIGTVLRYFVRQCGYPLWVIAPTAIKKYVTGSGSAKKDEMRLAVYKRWAFEHKSDNVVDAYALAQAGLGKLGVVDLTKVQLDTLKKVQAA